MAYGSSGFIGLLGAVASGGFFLAYHRRLAEFEASERKYQRELAELQDDKHTIGRAYSEIKHDMRHFRHEYEKLDRREDELIAKCAHLEKSLSKSVAEKQGLMQALSTFEKLKK